MLKDFIYILLLISNSLKENSEYYFIRIASETVNL